MSKSASKFAVLLVLVAASFVRAESLWPTEGAGKRGMVADRKASGVGDIVTVIVQESADASSTQSKKSNRSAAVNDAVSQFLYSAAASKFGTQRGETPNTQFTAKGDYSGGGAVNNSQSLSARAAVLVTDVLPNGNLVIAGVRMVKFSGETQYCVLHGLIRPDDISTVNSVFSANIADARVEFVAEGTLSDAQKRGWLAKVYEKLRPF